jgi:Integrase core domain
LRELNSKLRDELLNGEIFYTLAAAKVVIEGWRHHYNTMRPHSGCATRPSFAGPADGSATTNHELTSTLDHLIGASHSVTKRAESPPTRYWISGEPNAVLDKLSAIFLFISVGYPHSQ